MSNLYNRTLASHSKSDLWKTYGFILKYVGDGDFPAKTKEIYGIYNTDFSILSGANLETSPTANTINQALKGWVSGKIEKKVKHYAQAKSWGNPVANILKTEVEDRMGKSIAESIKVYDGANGRPLIELEAFMIPGLFDFKSYNDLEQFANYATLPKKVGSEKIGFSQHIYAVTDNLPGGFIDFSDKLFAIKINNLINIPGGMYITNFSRMYSNDRDENGKPIFCKINVSLEYYREMFADEFINIFSEF